jgi:hypothetical protein
MKAKKALEIAKKEIRMAKDHVESAAYFLERAKLYEKAAGMDGTAEILSLDLEDLKGNRLLSTVDPVTRAIRVLLEIDEQALVEMPSFALRRITDGIQSIELGCYLADVENVTRQYEEYAPCD